jgi:hypothetical protein
MLVETTFEFDMAVLNSAHYLNSPKAILNDYLDCMYRQFHNDLGTATKVIADFLKKYKIEKPIEKANDFVNWRKSISMAEFRKLNVNSYIDKTPSQVEHKHKSVNNWIERNTIEKWQWGNLVYRHTPSYPFGKL